MRPLDDVSRALSRSAFRRKFHLRAPEQAYLSERGLDVVLEHAPKFVAECRSPAQPRNDGKQTPYREHPLTPAEVDHVIAAPGALATC